jgi:hypothetical protein
MIMYVADIMNLTAQIALVGSQLVRAELPPEDGARRLLV